MLCSSVDNDDDDDDDAGGTQRESFLLAFVPTNVRHHCRCCLLSPSVPAPQTPTGSVSYKKEANIHPYKNAYKVIVHEAEAALKGSVDSPCH